MWLRSTAVIAGVLITSVADAQVVRIADLNTRQIQALDRSKTVVFVQGGMLEEPGPYLPAFTYGVLSDRLTRELAAGVAAKKPAWTALVFPPIWTSFSSAALTTTLGILAGADPAKYPRYLT